MATEESDKTEQPTPQKLRDALKKGQVARSMDVGYWASLAGFTAVFAATWTDSGAYIREMFFFSYEKMVASDFNAAMLMSSFISMTKLALSICLPVVFFSAISSVIAQISRTGVVFSSSPLKMDFSRLNPASGIKRIFEKKIAYDLLRSLFKILLLSLCVVYYINYTIFSRLHLEVIEPNYISRMIVELCLGLAWIIVWVLFPFAVIDFIHSGREHIKKMRMNRREIKEEHKRNEGSAEVKSKRAELQRAIRKRAAALGSIKDSDLVIVNPTHYAVALRYERERDGLPKIAAKGRNLMAARIRYLAKRYNKPVLRRPELARLLFNECEINDSIPASSYRVVAEVYKWLYSQKRDVAQ